MSRAAPEARRHASNSSVPRTQASETSSPPPSGGSTEGAWEFWALRVSLGVILAATAFALHPFGLAGLEAAATGLAIAAIVLAAEFRMRRAPWNGLLGGALGAAAGLASALAATLIVSRTSASEGTKSFFDVFSLCALPYLGLAVGSLRRGELPASVEEPVAVRAVAPGGSTKLLDTSVLIDGRIGDICEANFMDGTIAVPQFVLHELQLVADSADVLKRQRGRRGLVVLQRIQKMAHIDVRILNDESSQGSDVDRKLVELAKRLEAKIVTNDFNLNKVATVQGLTVLNVNQLANALKPAVLPGEPMRVLILREGKEANQGVAYLDDGTMVVVDGARKLINKSVEVVVTSVHQTTAGKMIFGRLEERNNDVSASGKAGAAAANRSDHAAKE